MYGRQKTHARERSCQLMLMPALQLSYSDEPPRYSHISNHFCERTPVTTTL